MLKQVLLGLIAVVSAANTLPGFGGSLTNAGAKDAKNIVMPVLYPMLKNISLGDMEMDGAKFLNIVADMPDPGTYDNIDAYLNGGDANSM